jgi:hypothetical protein
MLNVRFQVLMLFTLLALAVAPMALAAEEQFNYDEAKVGAYTLPNPLVMQDGTPVTTAEQWRDKRRPELIELFETQVYGRRPPKPTDLRFDIAATDDTAVDGRATRKQVRIHGLGGAGDSAAIVLTLYVPNNAEERVPAFVGMHLFDAAAAAPVPGKPLEVPVAETLPGAKLLEVILDRGYAIGTLTAADFCPDDAASFRNGVLTQLYPDQTGPPGPEQPGAIATWAWALSRALDYLQTDKAIDATRVAVIGHSRMGKTALWAGAEDQRFALVISNNSGCGGAALSRRNFGETVARINRAFPHWFCGNFKKYNDRENELPVDQHQLVALSAPRPVYVASAADDGWADPRGEFLAAAGADAVYKLLGVPGLDVTDQPAVGKVVGQHIGYHVRVGKHALTDYDWLRYLDFSDRQFGHAKPKVDAQ